MRTGGEKLRGMDRERAVMTDGWISNGSNIVCQPFSTQRRQLKIVSAACHLLNGCCPHEAPSVTHARRARPVGSTFSSASGGAGCGWRHSFGAWRSAQGPIGEALPEKQVRSVQARAWTHGPAGKAERLPGGVLRVGMLLVVGLLAATVGGLTLRFPVRSHSTTPVPANGSVAMF